MAFRLKSKENACDGIRRIVVEQVQKALEELTSEAVDRLEAVHSVRKRFKKIRSVLRLVRQPLGEMYSRENIFFRDAGRLLAEARNAQAMLEAYDDLAGACQDADFQRFSSIRNRFVQLRDNVAADTSQLHQNVTEVTAKLREAVQRVEQWPLSDKGFSLLENGLKRNYRRGRKSLRTAYKSPTDVNFHEWRKKVKYLWYHTSILERTWPAVMRTLQGELKTLSDYLGDDHDLAVMREQIQGAPHEYGDAATIELFVKLLAQRQQQLRKRARRVGRLLFAEKPSAFVSRLAQWWRISGFRR